MRRMITPQPEVPSRAGMTATEQHGHGASGDRTSSSIAVKSRSRQRLSPRPKGCTNRNCQCRCHTEGSVGGRFWGLQYTPLSMVLADCNDPRCDSRQYTTSFRTALSQFGLKWAVTAVAGIRSGGGSYSLDISLRPQHIVRYTSDGFLLLFNIMKKLIPLDQGISSFWTLYQSDPSLIHHVNPGGLGYIEVRMLRSPLFVY